MRRRLFLTAAGGWALGGCGTAEAPRPPRTPARRLPPGVRYEEHTVRLPAGPVRYQALSVAPDAPVKLGAVHGARLDSAETVRSMAKRAGAVAAVNGSFFDIRTSAVFSGYDGDPLGLYVEHNALLSEAANGRTALVLGEDAVSGRITEARSVSRVVAGDGAARLIDGVNRMPGRIVGCGGVGGDVLQGKRHTAPAHNKLCTDPDELVLFTPQWGTEAARAPAGTVEAVLAAGGRVLRLRTPAGGPVPDGGRVLQGTGTAAAWLRRHALPDTVLRITSQVYDSAGRRLSGKNLTVLQAGPRLLRDGRVDINIEANGLSPTALSQRHPRTLAGFTRDGTLLLMTVDGRDPGASIGVTMAEAAELMRAWHAHDALNLDGGGSTTMVVLGQLRNRPRGSNGARVTERAVANALVVVAAQAHA
ncbi:phosphodiester glycosidase family protein [Streptomyces sp. NBC_00726]|uniref:phosphodiester glycosidase family protein n=1 Tax=Streptomyces sp. NBC_00726 TaxID=2903674 RepID=UPI003863BEB0